MLLCVVPMKGVAGLGQVKSREMAMRGIRMAVLPGLRCTEKRAK